MKYGNIREEELKNKVAHDFFKGFDCTEIKGCIDFAVAPLNPPTGGNFPSPCGGGREEAILWAEAKSRPTDLFAMFAQLILTIGKARTFDKIMPPKFLGAFDSEKIAFVPYYEIQELFYLNDFNWNVTSSNTATKEFQLIKTKVENALTAAPWQTFLFYFEKDEKELRRFIKENFTNRHCGLDPQSPVKLRIDKNNFKIIFNKWAESVMPTIAVDWEKAKKNGIIAGDFYLADLLSENNKTLKEKLFVLLQNNFYEIDRHLNEMEFFTSSRVEFKDKQKAHNAFWAKYERPPQEDYWDFIINRRDLLVPPDVRERKGSFFTPRQCVELSQQYLADVFGENWQEEYYVWDCCAGTGNLLEGLTDKYRIFASTLDKQDVFVMHDRIENGANLLKSHVFQFDFLNDDFTKLPESLQKIINDEKLRKKLIIYINPPYAEAGNIKSVVNQGNIKSRVATANKTNEKYKKLIGNATNEISAQFMARIYSEISFCKLAIFSKVKFICAENFGQFRQFFKANFKKGFAVRADIFDNVSGKFPIAFTVWDLMGSKFPKSVELEIPEKNITKKFHDGLHKSINRWIRGIRSQKEDNIGYLICETSDFLKVHQPYLTQSSETRKSRQYYININNLIESCIYFAVRLCIQPTWLNDRDQFLFPNKKWEKDLEFQNDCLAFTLFHGQNRISAKDGVNHWIPFEESEINARTLYDSHILLGFLQGKKIQNAYTDLFEQQEQKLIKREFSPEATAVFDAGREIWRYYHKQKNANVNASLYDIREYFQGRDKKTDRMNNTSTNETYNELIGNLRETLNVLSAKIEPKVYEYEFLME